MTYVVGVVIVLLLLLVVAKAIVDILDGLD